MATVTEARPAKPSKFKRRRKNPGDSVARAIALGRRPPASGGNVAACAPCAAVEAPDWARRPVAYVHSAAGVAAASLHPQHPNRPRMVHALLNAYGLVDRMSVLSEVAVDRYTLTKFHSRGYVDYLQNARQRRQSSHSKSMSDGKHAEYGLEFDCQCFPNMYTYVRAVVGGTLAGARALITGETRTAIHWNGGRHHAQPSEAAGFCYVNDINLAILELMELGKVMYIDIDCHHGDGVEHAFLSSDRVLTMSLHRYGPGFFPGTGAVTDIGHGAGLGYSINVPLKEGVSDSNYIEIFHQLAPAAFGAFRPAVVVLQCGADALSRDPLGDLNLGPDAYTSCVREVLSWNAPTLLLGGGGYHSADTARCYAAVTATVLSVRSPESRQDHEGVRLDDSIPEHQYLPEYGPDFRLAIRPSKMHDSNRDSGYLNSICDTVMHNIELHLGNNTSA